MERKDRIKALETRLKGTEPQHPVKPGQTGVCEFRPYDLAAEFDLSVDEVVAAMTRVLR